MKYHYEIVDRYSYQYGHLVDLSNGRPTFDVREKFGDYGPDVIVGKMVIKVEEKPEPEYQI